MIRSRESDLQGSCKRTYITFSLKDLLSQNKWPELLKRGKNDSENRFDMKPLIQFKACKYTQEDNNQHLEGYT